jgi:hypothetical protein
VRNLTVGTSSLRIVRAQLPVVGPRMRATLTLENDTLSGTFENASDETLENVAIVLGSAVGVLGDVAPHATLPVRVPIRANPFGAPLAQQIVGQGFDQSSETGVRRSIRSLLINQLAFDPNRQSSGQALSADQAVILAFGHGEPLEVKLGRDEPRRNGNVMYYIPVGLRIHGPVTFASDLLQLTVVDSDAQNFTQERSFLSMGFGTATIAYRPIPFEGAFNVSEVRMSLGTSGNVVGGAGKEVEPLPSIPVACTDAAHTTPVGCEAPRNDFLPEVEVFDVTGAGTWVRLPRLGAEASYTLARPSRFVDPVTGQMLVRFINESPEASVQFTFQLALVGDVE